MTFSLAGLIECLVFLGVIMALLSLHSRRLDHILAITWLVVVLAASAHTVYRQWLMPRGRKSGAPASGWAFVLPPKVMRWLLGETDRRDSSK